ncbi:hypothetical protein L596_000805 [Steinernema carpocapsae]|uniref:RNA helicase n=1 Tax=Steinernema carpocapsae TaxID=34508 RepID=A0A4U8UJZ2_STECR|nr:hypothetical protein L596_000805 [Steinernema carpocapsae]
MENNVLGGGRGAPRGGLISRGRGIGGPVGFGRGRGMGGPAVGLPIVSTISQVAPQTAPVVTEGLTAELPIAANASQVTAQSAPVIKGGFAACHPNVSMTRQVAPQTAPVAVVTEGPTAELPIATNASQVTAQSAPVVKGGFTALHPNVSMTRQVAPQTAPVVTEGPTAELSIATNASQITPQSAPVVKGGFTAGRIPISSNAISGAHGIIGTRGGHRGHGIGGPVGFSGARGMGGPAGGLPNSAPRRPSSLKDLPLNFLSLQMPVRSPPNRRPSSREDSPIHRPSPQRFNDKAGGPQTAPVVTEGPTAELPIVRFDYLNIKASFMVISAANASQVTAQSAPVVKGGFTVLNVSMTRQVAHQTAPVVTEGPTAELPIAANASQVTAQSAPVVKGGFTALHPNVSMTRQVAPKRRPSSLKDLPLNFLSLQMPVRSPPVVKGGFTALHPNVSMTRQVAPQTAPVVTEGLTARFAKFSMTNQVVPQTAPVVTKGPTVRLHIDSQEDFDKPEGLRQEDFNKPGGLRQDGFLKREGRRQEDFDKPEGKELKFGGDPNRPPPSTYIPATKGVAELFKEDENSAVYADVAEGDDDIVVSGIPEGKIIVCKTWDDCHFDPLLKDNIVNRCKYAKPRKIQASVIPLILEGYDVVGRAETGGGKTAAFLLPIVQKILTGPPLNPQVRCCPTAIIIGPTRELVLQLSDQARKFADSTAVTVAKTYGQYNVHENLREIRTGCSILCATPGRLKHFAMNKEIRFDQLKFLILDEADHLLENNFWEDMREVINMDGFPPVGKRQTLLFSATISDSVKQLANTIMRLDKTVTVTNKKSSGQASSRVLQKFIEVHRQDKNKKVREILVAELEQAREDRKKKGGNPDEAHVRRTLVFTRMKRTTDLVAAYLSDHGIMATSINSDRSQELRERALNDLRENRCHVLVATDVCARGIDVHDLEHVINYDLPTDAITYVHRIGRTGRLYEGTATSFIETGHDSSGLCSQIVEIVRGAQQEPPKFLVDAAEGRTSGNMDGGFGGGFEHQQATSTFPENYGW